MARLINEALRRLEIERPVLIGHSYGGAVMLQYLLDYPDQVRGAMSLGGVAYVDEQAFRPAEAPAAYVEAISSLYLRPAQFTATARELADMYPSVGAMSSRYDEITVPVTIVFGDADQMLSVDVDARRLHDALPDSRLVLVGGAGHKVHHTHPDVVLDALDRLVVDTVSARR